MHDGPVQTGDTSANRDPDLWRSVRWFVAEFAVVVSGVLVALGLNAYYQGRQEIAREQAYLRQIASDLRESADRFTEAIEKNDEDIERLGLLLEAFTADPPPPESDLSRLVTIGFSAAEPTTGASRALVLTGDLHLLRDDSVRSAIIHFVSQSEAYTDRVRRVEWQWLRPSIAVWFRAARPAARRDHHPFAVRISGLLDDSEVFDAVADLRLGFVNYVRMQRRMLEEIRETQADVDEALGE